jgi:hypothetical protein
MRDLRQSAGLPRCPLRPLALQGAQHGSVGGGRAGAATASYGSETVAARRASVAEVPAALALQPPLLP